MLEYGKDRELASAVNVYTAPCLKMKVNVITITVVEALNVSLLQEGGILQRIEQCKPVFLEPKRKTDFNTVSRQYWRTQHVYVANSGIDRPLKCLQLTHS